MGMANEKWNSSHHEIEKLGCSIEHLNYTHCLNKFIKNMYTWTTQLQLPQTQMMKIVQIENGRQFNAKFYNPFVWQVAETLAEYLNSIHILVPPPNWHQQFEISILTSGIPSYRTSIHTPTLIQTWTIISRCPISKLGDRCQSE